MFTDHIIPHIIPHDDLDENRWTQLSSEDGRAFFPALLCKHTATACFDQHCMVHYLSHDLVFCSLPDRLAPRYFGNCKPSATTIPSPVWKKSAGNNHF